MFVASSLLFLASLTHRACHSAWLRIIQINDVYDLERFPRVKSLMDHYKKDDGPDACIAICAGDFLAPSLLSSLDKGLAMVDIFNTIGIDYVCFGNHEADVGNEALVKRIHQSKSFTWINSNVPDLTKKLPIKVDVPSHVVLQVGHKRVALLGLLTEDSSLYRPGAFGDATIEPILSSAQDWIQQLQEVDLVLPMTHQGISQDRDLAHALGDRLPLIMGGHDHEIFLETVNGCQIVKTGMDAHHAAIIDIQWSANNMAKPTVRVQMVDTLDFAVNSFVQQRVAAHESSLKELDKAKLFPIQEWATASHGGGSDEDCLSFSTHNNRLQPSSGTTALCSMLRMGLRCDVCLLNAGCVRGNKDYSHDALFTWSDMKTELPYATRMSVCKIPGSTIQESIQYSRRFAPEKIAKGGYIHASKTTVCLDDGTIHSILGEPFDPNRLYLTAFPQGFLKGIDDQRPFLEWAASQQAEDLPSSHSAVPAKIALVELFSALLWLRFGSFEDVSKGDTAICQQDVRERMRQLYGDEEIADVMADSVFAIADQDGDGLISPIEQMITHFVAADMLDHVVTEKEIEVMKKAAAQVLGKDPSHEELERMVEQIRASLDLKGNGSIQRDEIINALGQVAGKDLLQ